MINRSKFVVLLAGMLTVLAADTIPGGDVSGTWYAINSPYYITGEITIPVDSLLTIEPGVEVNFLGHYRFIVDGVIHAVGTEQDSILFTATDPDTGWWGLRFTNAPDGSQLTYCILQYGRATGGIFLDKRGGAIHARYSRLQITHSNIRNNIAETWGGGIYVDGIPTGPFPPISHCIITDNSSGSYGGGIYFHAGSFDIADCTVNGNIAGSHGGGLHILSGAADSVYISNCIVSDDSSTSYGGGIYVDAGYSSINGSTIANNRAGLTGGGLFLDAYLDMRNSTIQGNTSWGGLNDYEVGGGGLITYASALVDSCVIADNISYTGSYLSRGGGINFNQVNSAVVRNSKIINNSADVCGGIFFRGVSTVTMEYCEISSNQVTMAGTAGAEFWSGTTNIDHCTISENVAPGGGYGGLNTVNAADISNSIFSWNSPSAIYRQNTAGAVDYSDFFGNGQDIVGLIPPGFGVLDTINYNVDSCDTYFNIFLDPMFEDTANGNYHLTLGSPCIDAGNPTFQYDPDSTITDMGAYWFDQTGIAENPIIKHVKEDNLVGATIFSGPLQLPAGVKYKVLDITGRVVEPNQITRGIYFIEIDGQIARKVVKVR